MKFTFPQKFNAYHIMWMLITLQLLIGILIISHPGEDVHCTEQSGRLYCNNPADTNK